MPKNPPDLAGGFVLQMISWVSKKVLFWGFSRGFPVFFGHLWVIIWYFIWYFLWVFCWVYLPKNRSQMAK